jgi:hypothetical protein
VLTSTQSGTGFEPGIGVAEEDDGKRGDGRRSTMITFVIGMMVGSAFGVCLMGALWAREREERVRELIAVTPHPMRPSGGR